MTFFALDSLDSAPIRAGGRFRLRTVASDGVSGPTFVKRFGTKEGGGCRVRVQSNLRFGTKEGAPER